MTAAARQKLRRSREAMGLRVYRVVAGAGLIEGLCWAGFLAERDQTDDAAVSEAISRMAAKWGEEQLASRVTALALGQPYNATRKDRI
jgi:hypothetical protein